MKIPSFHGFPPGPGPGPRPKRRGLSGRPTRAVRRAAAPASRWGDSGGVRETLVMVEGIPKMDGLGWFIMENFSKMDDIWGYPHFRKSLTSEHIRPTFLADLR